MEFFCAVFRGKLLLELDNKTNSSLLLEKKLLEGEFSELGKFCMFFFFETVFGGKVEIIFNLLLNLFHWMFYTSNRTWPEKTHKKKVFLII